MSALTLSSRAPALASLPSALEPLWAIHISAQITRGLGPIGQSEVNIDELNAIAGLDSTALQARDVIGLGGPHETVYSDATDFELGVGAVTVTRSTFEAGAL